MHVEHRAIIVFAVILSAACGGGVGGRYVGQGETLFSSLTFGDDGKVEMDFAGMLRDGTYVMEGDNIIVTAPNGDRVRLRPASGGCYSNEAIGTYCKGANSPRAEGSSDSRSAGDETYEATAREGRVLLEFADTRNVRVTMTPTGGSEMPQRVSIDASYQASGDRITVHLPGGENLVLTRAGTSLEGAMGGEMVRFVRR